MKNYDESSIKIIEDDVEKIKQSYGMYIGTTGFAAVLHLFKEVIQNSIDEANAHMYESITVEVNEQKRKITVTDLGRGIPLKVMEKICTIIQSSGKFDKGNNNAYGRGVSGMHGIGLTAVNALSTEFTMEVYRDDTYKKCKFEFGHIVDTVIKEAVCHETGTKISFIVNDQIIGKYRLDYNQILNLCEMLSYLCKVKIICKIKTANGDNISKKYYSKNGIKDLVIKDIDPYIKPIYLSYTEEDMFVEVAFTYVSDPSDVSSSDDNIISFANSCTTVEHGKHVDGFKQAISNVLIKLVKENLNKKEAKLNITSDDIRSGLVAVVNVELTDALFSGQIKAKLINDDVDTFVRKAIQTQLSKWIKENESSVKKLITYIKVNAKARTKASEEKKSVLKKSTSIFNAFSKDNIKNLTMANGKENLEILLVEGDSAATELIKARDRAFQAIYKFRGVPLNTIGLSIAKILENAEIKGLVMALGTNIGSKFDLSKCNFDKIIIMTDADRLMSA